MQYSENKYITIARMNAINCYLKSYFRSIQKEAKQNFVSMQYNENKYITLARINEINYCLQ